MESLSQVKAKKQEKARFKAGVNAEEARESGDMQNRRGLGALETANPGVSKGLLIK